jgi:colanic acid/amylovoran biosynthesis protein
MEGDENAIGQFLKKCPPELAKDVSALYYDGSNYQQLCSCISSAACLVATRFHSLVLGLAYNIPTIPICYSNKALQLLQDLGLEAAAIIPAQLAQAEPTPVTASGLDRLEAAAEQHFTELDKRLNESERKDFA